jgi:hypothetical protein
MICARRAKRFPRTWPLVISDLSRADDLDSNSVMALRDVLICRDAVVRLMVLAALEPGIRGINRVLPEMLRNCTESDICTMFRV